MFTKQLIAVQNVIFQSRHKYSPLSADFNQQYNIASEIAFLNPDTTSRTEYHH